MTTSWTVLELRELGRVVTGRTPAAERPHDWGNVTPFLTPTDMDGRRRVGATGRALSEHGSKELSRCIVQRAVGVSCIGWQMGKAVWIDQPAAMNQQINAVIPDPRLADDLFLYYALSTRRDEIFRLGSGGSRTPILKKSEFERLEVDVPPLDEQRAIAEVLGALDDKVELNRQMNRTLEEMASALFKSWFIDFDPVVAKADGRKPFGMDAATAALFPSAFETGDEGDYPVGWRWVSLGDITDKIGSGATPTGGASVYVDAGVSLIRSQNVYDFQFIWDGLAHIGEAHAKALAGVTVQPKDVLINITGASFLRTCVVDPGVLPARVNQHVAIVRAARGVPPHFLHLNLVRPWMKEFLAGHDAGGSRQAITKAHLEGVPILLPGQGVLDAFDRQTTPWFELIESNTRESRTLTTLRDTLLPKLLSGEVRLKQAARLVEAAT